MSRLETILAESEKRTVNAAFENLNNLDNLSAMLSRFPSPNAGYCYDSCHHFNFSPGIDLLKPYGHRRMALHLQDNGGTHNQHQLPPDGKIDWQDVMQKIARTDYRGATSLEPMNWDYTHLSIQQFLERKGERNRWAPNALKAQKTLSAMKITDRVPPFYSNNRISQTF